MRGNTLGVEATIPIAAALETQPHLKVSLDYIILINLFRERCGVTCSLED